MALLNKSQLRLEVARPGTRTLLISGEVLLLLLSIAAVLLLRMRLLLWLLSAIRKED